MQKELACKYVKKKLSQLVTYLNHYPQTAFCEDVVIGDIRIVFHLIYVLMKLYCEVSSIILHWFFFWMVGVIGICR